jgi:hypothetical protein
MDEDETPKAPPKDPTLALFLGLYLILLAFFVLLNTMATLKEDRIKAVLSSLLATFSTEILSRAAPTEFAASVGEILAVEEFHREIRDFFESAVPLARVESFSAGTVMRIRLPADQLFEPESIRIRADRDELLYRIERAMTRDVEEVRYEVQLTTFTGPFLGGDTPPGNLLEVARAGAFARALDARGVPRGAVVIGALPGNPDELELTFRLRVLEGAKIEVPR